MMERFFTQFPPQVGEILSRLEDAGWESWVVGGCVRDVLLGRPVHDWDICTAATPQQVTELFSDCRVLPTGVEHGTVTLLYGGQSYEITMFRRESAYDGRRPGRVEPAGDIREDLSRRDFSMNAMAFHPQRGLLDCFGGQEDLEQKLIRAVGRAEARFSEDALRILRALRFAACYGLELEEQTAAAAFACAGGLAQLSGERVWQELSRLLDGPFAGAVLAQYGKILQGLGAGWTGYELPCGAARLEGFAPEKGGSLWGRLALVLWERPALLETLRCPRVGKERLRRIWQQAAAIPKGEGRELLAWLAAFPKKDRAKDCAAALYLAGQEALQEPCEALLHSGIPLEVGDLAISGKELLTLGLEAGPQLGQTLHRLLTAVWQGEAANEREALLHFCGLCESKERKEK